MPIESKTTADLLEAMWRARFRRAIDVEHGFTTDRSTPPGLGIQEWMPEETDHYQLFVARLAPGQPRSELGVSVRLLERLDREAVVGRFRTAVETAVNNPGVRWFLPLSGELIEIEAGRA